MERDTEGKGEEELKWKERNQDRIGEGVKEEMLESLSEAKRELSRVEVQSDGRSPLIRSNSSFVSFILVLLFPEIPESSRGRLLVIVLRLEGVGAAQANRGKNLKI